MQPKFISATELSRECGCSVGKIINAVESGMLTPAGRCGSHKHAAIIFMKDDLPDIMSALAIADLAGGAQASIKAPRQTHICGDAAEIRMKAASLHQALEEAKR
jgi:hypothetical protein